MGAIESNPAYRHVGDKPLQRATRNNFGSLTADERILIEGEDLRARKQESTHTLRRLVASFAWIQAILAFIVLCATMSSFVWTNDNLASADIPYYTPGMTAWKVERWNAAHVFLVLSLPAYIIPALTLFTIYMNPFITALTITHIFVSIVCILFDIGAMVIWIWAAIDCDGFAVCRSEVGAASPSLYYYFLVIGDGLMIVLTILSIVFAGMIRHSYNILYQMYLMAK